MTTNPYSPPSPPSTLAAPAPTADSPPDDRARLRWLARRSALWFLGSVGLVVASIVADSVLGSSASRPLAFLGCLGAALSALVGFARAFGALRAARRVASPGIGLVTLGVFALLGNFAMMGIGLLGAFLSTVTFSRGRQLRRFGRVLLPPLARGEEWAARREPIPVDDVARDRLASRWRENGRSEHASVAAFARLTLDLLALGAPPRLVAAAQRDALDEIAHAEVCFALARAIDGSDVSPGAFPEASRARTLSRVRLLALAELAVDSLVDGALNEGVSARIITRLARRSEVPAITAALRRIASDEGRHAAHGWDVVEWCVAEGGEPVVSALEGAALALPKTMRTPLPEEASRGAWERWGIHGWDLEGEEYASARAHVVRSVAKLGERVGGRGVAA